MNDDKSAKDQFNKEAELNKQQYERLEIERREAQVEQIKSLPEREQIKSMMMLRDEILKIEGQRAEKEQEAIAQREIQRRAQARAPLNLVEQGGQSEDPKEIEEVRGQVRAVHGPELDKHRTDLQATLNREIDQAIREVQQRQPDEDSGKRKAPMKKDWTAEAAEKPRGLKPLPAGERTRCR